MKPHAIAERAAMGMYDHVVVLDEELRCPHNPLVDDFQTKSFDEPSMDTYLFDGSRVFRVASDESNGNESEPWQLHGNEAVYQRRYPAEHVTPAREVVREPILGSSRRARRGASQCRNERSTAVRWLSL
jgi:hypothetical protein